MPSMPTKPVSALGNQYVTFNPEQPELFIMKQKIWTSHQAFDVKDIALNDWFKIEGKDAQVRGDSSMRFSSVPSHGAPCGLRKRKNRGVVLVTGPAATKHARSMLSLTLLCGVCSGPGKRNWSSTRESRIVMLNERA